MIAYLEPVFLVGLLIYYDSNPANPKFNSMVEKTDFNQGLSSRALEKVMKVSLIA